MTCGDVRWAYEDLNLGPLPCQGSALPLSYTPAEGKRSHPGGVAPTRGMAPMGGAGGLTLRRWRPSGGRLGAFVDGVYAIAATLLVLELPLPDVAPGELGPALGELGGGFAAYGIGFLQMVSGWLQTRRLETWLRGVDHYATLLVMASLGVYSLTPSPRPRWPAPSPTRGTWAARCASPRSS